MSLAVFVFFFFQAEDGIRDLTVTGVQTCALPISRSWHRHVQLPVLSWRRRDLYDASLGSGERGTTCSLHLRLWPCSSRLASDCRLDSVDRWFPYIRCCNQLRAHADAHHAGRVNVLALPHHTQSNAECSGSLDCMFALRTVPLRYISSSSCPTRQYCYFLDVAQHDAVDIWDPFTQACLVKRRSTRHLGPFQGDNHLSCPCSDVSRFLPCR